MERYIALLRGINISGKNKIAMAQLKAGFAESGFTEVSTYLNSGNVVFSSDCHDEAILADTIETMIRNRFALEIPALVIRQQVLKEMLNNAPDWWGEDNKEIYDNLIFMLPPLTYEKLYEEIGEPKAEYERVQQYREVIFWSFDRKNYQKTNWWSKTANSGVSNRLTIRTANTVRKIAEM